MNAIAQIVDVTAMSRVFENGSRKLPARGAEIAKPKIIIIQTADAAKARRRGSTWVASIARTEVPAEPAPIPSNKKDSAATETPRGRELAASAVPSAAPIPPSARAPIPPMTQGVRRPPTSDP